jgi:ribosomal protein S18 acetylase RimI-like enzyme
MSSAMMNRHIRPFHKDDTDSIIHLALRAWEPVFVSLSAVMDKEVFEAFYPDWREVQAAAVRATLANDEVRSWVMVSEGGILGFVAGKLHHSDKMGEIFMVAVEPSVQNTGIAQALCHAAEAWMRASGMIIVMVETGGDTGHAPARATYQRLGYKELPISRYFKSIKGTT